MMEQAASLLGSEQLPRSRPRVTATTFEFAPIYIGGLGTILRSVYENIDTTQFEVTIVLPRSGCSIPWPRERTYQQEHCDVEVYRQGDIEIHLLCNDVLDAAPIYPKPDQVAGIRKIDEFGERVAELLPTLRPDILHLHDLYGYKALGAARRLGIPCILTVHRIHQEYPHWFFCEEVAVRWVDRITVVSETYRQELGSFFDEVKCHAITVPNGCDLGFWRLPQPPDSAHTRLARRDGLCERFGFATAATAVYFGRLNAYHKGLDVLLDAVGQLGADTPLNLLVIGEGDPEMERAIRRFCQHDPEHRRFENLLYTAEQLRDVLGAVDMMIVPSRYEPFGLVQIEGMAMGAIPMVSATGGLRDVAIEASEEGGFARLFAPGDAKALAGAISEMVAVVDSGGEACERLRRNAMRRAGDYSAVEIASRYVEVYREVLRAPRGKVVGLADVACG